MTMGKRRQRQEALFVTTEGLARSPGQPLYRKLIELLAGRLRPLGEAPLRKKHLHSFILAAGLNPITTVATGNRTEIL